MQLEELANGLLAGEKTLKQIIQEAYEMGQQAYESPEHVLSGLIGRNVFMRSVTHHYTGKLIGIRDGFLVLTDASWIADDGRFHTAMATGEFNEVEPYPCGLKVYIPLGSLNDIHEHKFPLPRQVK